jgi:hypothetical protein
MLSYSIFINAEKLSQSIEKLYSENESAPIASEYQYDPARDIFRKINSGECFLVERKNIDFSGQRTIELLIPGKKVNY